LLPVFRPAERFGFWSIRGAKPTLATAQGAVNEKTH
jgi:hypothetical protein